MTQSDQTPPIQFPAERRLFYAGAWHDPQGGYSDTFNPATGESLGPAANANAEDVQAAVAAAKSAFGAWRDTTPLERAERLRAIAGVVRQHIAELALLESANNGNPVRAIAANLQYAAQLIEYFAGLAVELKGETLPGAPSAIRMTLREPIGVCARLVAYNHPVLFLASKFAPAVAAGNSVIMKAPDQAPLSSLRLLELIGDLLPPGVLNLLTGGRECGAALVEHPDIPMVTLIGGVETGRSIARASASRLKRVLLELGGKNALVVYPDADLDAAAAAAVQGMSFGWCGQSCGSTSRLFLHRDIHDAVVDRVVELARGFKPGLPTDPNTTMGALISREHLDRVLTYIDIGKAEGAKLVYGGARPSDPTLARGSFVEPTIFTEVTPRMRIAQEEIFGPILSVLRWHEEGEMLDQVNAVEYGLTASIFSRDLGAACRLARRIDAGSIAINNIAFHALGSPFGGYKQSGIGREECVEELHAFTQTKTVNLGLESP